MSDRKQGRVFVDANVFLRVFVGGNENQKQDSKAFVRAIEDTAVAAVTLPVVVAEVQWVTKSAYELPKSKRVEVVERLVEIPGLSIVESVDMGQVLALYREYDVKFIDCMIGTYVLAEQIPIVSYDTDFDVLGCERLEPVDMIEQ